MGNDKWLYGRAVVNGVPQFHSVSRLTGADDSSGGCLRSWWYEMVGGKKRGKTRASKRGDDLHAELEKFLKTGDRSLSSLALSGMHMVPEPGPDLLVEWDLVLRPQDVKPANEAEAAAILARAPLTADGVPVLGRMDLIHGRCTNKGGANVEDTLDPPNTIEVYDWKSTGRPDYIKRAKDLPKLIQMAGYAEWVYRVEPRTDEVRLSHGYFVESGGPSRKVSLRVHRDDIQETWQHAEGVARRIRHAAAEVNPDLVDANTGACESYGGCTHREYCKARMHKALVSFVGQTAADKLLNKHQEKPMGLLDKLKSGAIAPAPALAAPSLAAGILAPPAAAAPDPAIAAAAAAAAERAKLEAEEIALRAERAKQELTDKITPLCEKLVGYRDANGEKVGMPAFTGAMAAAIGSTGDVPGQGPLGQKVTIATFEDLAETVRQLDELAAAKQILSPPPPPGSVMPNAPAPAGLLSPETPASAPPAADTVVATVTSEAPAAKKTAKKKPAVTLPAPAAPAAAAASVSDAQAQPEVSGSFSLVVDAVIELPGVTLQPFNPIFDAIIADLARETNDADVRCPQEKSPLAYGKWDGAVAAMTREREIASGVYTFDTRGNRAAEVVADALRERCRSSGGFFVWGRR